MPARWPSMWVWPWLNIFLIMVRNLHRYNSKNILYPLKM